MVLIRNWFHYVTCREYPTRYFLFTRSTPSLLWKSRHYKHQISNSDFSIFGKGFRLGNKPYTLQLSHSDFCDIWQGIQTLESYISSTVMTSRNTTTQQVMSPVAIGTLIYLIPLSKPLYISQVSTLTTREAEIQDNLGLRQKMQSIDQRFKRRPRRAL